MSMRHELIDRMEVIIPPEVKKPPEMVDCGAAHSGGVRVVL